MNTHKPHATNHDRVLVEAARRACARYGISCTGFSDDWVIVLEKDGGRHTICGYALETNTEAGSMIATDKVAAYQLLAAAGLAATPHHLLSTVADSRIDHGRVAGLLAQYGELVVKPLKGRCGELVARFDDTDSILRYAAASGEPEWAASPYVDIRRELRLVVFDRAVRLAYEKLHPVVIHNLKFFNLSLGAEAEALELRDIPTAMSNLALRSLDAVGLRLGAVDIAVDEEGKAKVLEINSHFSLGRFAAASAANKERVLDFYESVIGGLFGLR